jgi:predicted RNA binding protein YcfA (HicA-like mRNA interferase family)
VNPRLPAVSARQVIRVLRHGGWELDRVRGSHNVFRHPDHPTRVVVPLHGGDLRKGTLNAIINGSGLTREEFLRRLR